MLRVTGVGRQAAAASTGALRVKRTLDLCLAATALVLLSPIIVITALLVCITSPGPVLLRQVRIGRDERPFEMLKFRTMYAGADDRVDREFNVRELAGDQSVAAGGVFRIADDTRITPVGRLLRRYSLDELPQLINVLRGDMSLVGPRPSLPWEVQLFTADERRRHRCLPGMTGLWQVSGRNRLSMKEMLKLDLVYTDTWSLHLDLRILARTPRAVLLDRNTR